MQAMSEDIRLEPGERLVVLATMRALHNAEHGISAERGHQIRILGAVTEEAAFEGARTICRLTGCSLGTARAFMSQISATFSQNLFRHQAQRLVHDLYIAGVQAEVVPMSVSSTEKVPPATY
jgi:hypothetical protein